jgi:GT2 family glycosyltransferase
MILSIIILNYNTKDLTLKAINSAWSDAQKSELLKGKTEIIVVDNNSKDDSVKTLRETFHTPHIHIIASKENGGFAKGNNIGISQAKGAYVLLLNSDTIVQHGALENLVTSLEMRPDDSSTAVLESHHGRLDRLGLLAATLLNEDGTLQPQGGSFPTLLSLFSHMTMLDDIPLLGRLLPSTQHTGMRQTEKLRYRTSDPRLIQRDWVGATALLIRKDVFDEIGLLDENIFMYGEDVEFCMRAKHHHWDIAIHPQAKITHYGSASSSSERAIIGELVNYYYIWSKHKPLWQQPIARLILKLGALLRIIIFGTIARDAYKQEAYRKAFAQL